MIFMGPSIAPRNATTVAEPLYFPTMETITAATKRVEKAGKELRIPDRGPRILIYDIETAPALVYVWSQWQTNVIDTHTDWYILCFAYKWYGDKTTSFVSVQQDPRKRRKPDDDRYVVERLAYLFDQADVVIAHNGDQFDAKKANARILFHGLNPPSPYRQIDTKKEVKRYMNHYSNALNELGRFHRLGEKVGHGGFSLWKGCMAGDKDSWKTMEKYNRQDVNILEVVWLKLRPWIGSPGKYQPMNYGFWSDGTTTVCPKCGSDDLIKRGFHRTLVNTYQTLQCKECGGYARRRLPQPKYGGSVGAV